VNGSNERELIRLLKVKTSDASTQIMFADQKHCTRPIFVFLEFSNHR